MKAGLAFWRWSRRWSAAGSCWRRVLLAFAVWRRAVVVPALVVYLVHAVLHVVIHTRFAGHLPAAQSAMLLTVLGMLVVVAVVLLVLAVRTVGGRSPLPHRPG